MYTNIVMRDKSLIIVAGGALLVILTVGILSMLVLSKSDKKSQPTQGNSYLNPGNNMAENKMDVMLSAQNGSNQSGVANLVETNGTVTVTLNLTGSTTNVPQPAHIHAGVCPGVGVVKFPLSSVVSGNSVTVLNVSFAQLKQQMPLAINVHKSADDIATYTSCGSL
jgi:hypothetical protein